MGQAAEVRRGEQQAILCVLRGCSTTLSSTPYKTLTI